MEKFSRQTAVSTSIQLIRDFEDVAISRSQLGYVVGYSGGKDSDVLLELFKQSGVRFYVIHNHTTIDAPETVYYVRKKFAELESMGIPCKIYYPRNSFWKLCEEQMMLPTRLMRFCCRVLKEQQNPELRFATRSYGVRKAESARRAENRDSIEMMNNRKKYKEAEKFNFDDAEDVKQFKACYTNNYLTINPLAYWTNEMVWDFIASEKLETNPLYRCGFRRVGCIGCPMATAKDGRIEEFKRYPIYKQNFIHLCDRIIRKRKCLGRINKHNFKTGEEYFEWWLELSKKK